MYAVAAFLNYKRHDLAESMGRQLEGCPMVMAFDNGGELGDDLPGVDLVLHRKKNLMFARGWNWAMKVLQPSVYKYVWMLNDDLEGVDRGMLDWLVRVFPDDAAIVTPAFNSPHPIFHPQPPGGLRQVSWVDWCCPLVRKEAWEDVGEFDPRFVGYGADLDWCRRAREKGWKFYVHNGLVVHHLGSATALSQGLQSKQGNVAEMNRLLKEKWGVKDWSEMV